MSPKFNRFKGSAQHMFTVHQFPNSSFSLLHGQTRIRLQNNTSFTHHSQHTRTNINGHFKLTEHNQKIQFSSQLTGNLPVWRQMADPGASCTGQECQVSGAVGIPGVVPATVQKTCVPRPQQWPTWAVVAQTKCLPPLYHSTPKLISNDTRYDTVVRYLMSTTRYQK